MAIHQMWLCSMPLSSSLALILYYEAKHPSLDVQICPKSPQIISPWLTPEPRGTHNSGYSILYRTQEDPENRLEAIWAWISSIWEQGPCSGGEVWFLSAHIPEALAIPPPHPQPPRHMKLNGDQSGASSSARQSRQGFYLSQSKSGTVQHTGKTFEGNPVYLSLLNSVNFLMISLLYGTNSFQIFPWGTI